MSAPAEEHDYRNRREDLDGAEILTPRGSPAWAQDRARLWNAVEAAERRKDAQVAREVRVAIPRELSADDRRALVRDYAQRSFVDRGMVADIAFHGGQGENPHAHIMLTTRTLTPEGFGNKNRQWNKKEHLVTWAQGLGRPREQRPCARWPRRAHRPSDAGRAAGRGPGERRPRARRLPRSRSADPPGPRGPHRRRDEAADRADDERPRDRGRQPRARAGAHRLV